MTCGWEAACASRSTAARCGVGWSRTTWPRQPGVDLLPLKSWLGWGPPPPLVRADRVGGVALGGAGVVLPAGGLPGHARAHAARTAPAHCRHDAGRGRRGGTPLRLGPVPRRAGCDGGAPAPGHRPDRPRARRCRRSGRAQPGRQHRRARPVDRVGGAAHGPAPAAGLSGHGLLGGGAGGVAGGGREPGGGMGAGAAAGRRRRLGRPRRGLPGGEHARLQRSGGAPRASPAGGEPLPPGVTGPTGRARRAHGSSPVEATSP